MTNSGLPNVWLASGYETGEDKFGPYYSINDLPGLYVAIAMAITSGDGSLTAGELRLLRRQLDMTQAALAAALGYTEQNILLWERRGAIPAPAARQVKLMVLRQLHPAMSLNDAFGHLTKIRPERLVFSRLDNRWAESIQCDYLNHRPELSWEPAPNSPIAPQSMMNLATSSRSAQFTKETPQWSSH
jgi:DNA-binding transcriptional regulator YiaG